MEGKHKNYKIYISYICFAAMVVLGVLSFAEADSVVIENNVSATANTGGNVVEGSGEIKTGNASASSSSSTTVKGGGETKVEVKAKAEANGKKAEAEVREVDPKENISVQKEVQEGNAEAKVDIDVSTDQGNQGDGKNGAENTAESEDGGEADGNFFSKITENISNAAKSFWEGIISLLS